MESLRCIQNIDCQNWKSIRVVSAPNLMPFPFKPNVFQSLLSYQKIQLIHSQPITVKWTTGRNWNFKVIFALWPIYKQSTPLFSIPEKYTVYTIVWSLRIRLRDLDTKAFDEVDAVMLLGDRFQNLLKIRSRKTWMSTIRFTVRRSMSFIIRDHMLQYT